MYSHKTTEHFALVSGWNCIFTLFKQLNCSQATVIDPQSEFISDIQRKLIDRLIGGCVV